MGITAYHRNRTSSPHFRLIKAPFIKNFITINITMLIWLNYLDDLILPLYTTELNNKIMSFKCYYWLSAELRLPVILVPKSLPY
ncbi:hypothetical protein CW304_26105 [Bacillus sp. UFRGS-B20]|nr:hypothetical protein CW304_26105 [Bacillus sp. UFRGS-B20]